MEFHPFGFGNKTGETSAEVLGGKGAGLVWMDAQGVTVPPGFIIPTTVWAQWDKAPKTTMKEIAKNLKPYLAGLEEFFGYKPLLSVRSGSRVSCPGMMDTILNVGIDEASSDEWVSRLGPECFGNSLHRLVVMYGSVVKGIRREDLEPNLSMAMDQYSKQTGETFPDATAQLLGAIEAVFRSWDNERAKVYRDLNKIPREWGTAVTVQAMVFGNLNEKSGTGVLFTRNPDTGGMSVTGEWLPMAQGEDIVAGIRTPLPLEDMKEWNPEVYDELLKTVINLENVKRDVQDVEFTVQNGKLFLLQTRNAKRSATAAIKIALDMVQQGLLTKTEAVKRVAISQFDNAQASHIDPKFTKAEAFKGIPACSGVVQGKPVFSKEDAINCKEPCILIAGETTPDDIAGMYAATGVVTMVGGTTSHAAVVARSMSRACIVGVGQSVDSFKDVEVLSMDGATGRIWTEKIPIIAGESNGLVKAFGKLVCDALGVVPVIFGVPHEEMPEALLYLGDKMLHTDGAAKLVVAVAEKVQRLYLDLLPVAGSPEAEYLKLVATYDPAQVLVNHLLLNEAALKDRLVVLGNVKTKFPKLNPGTDLRALVLASQVILLDGIDTSDPAVAQVLKWKQAEGLETVSLGQYVPGSKSVMSVEQALHTIHGV